MLSKYAALPYLMSVLFKLVLFPSVLSLLSLLYDHSSILPRSPLAYILILKLKV